MHKLNTASLTILFLLITTILRGQEKDIELKKIGFKGINFIATKEAILKSFGPGEKVATNYDCGFFTNDQEGGPYYQLVYANFNYIGSDTEEFYLENVTFDLEGKTIVYYGNSRLSGKTTVGDFVKVFGNRAKEYFEKYPAEDSILLFSKSSDDGAIFTFKAGRLFKFEYWTPC
ncbi:MAG TPA: hypothetical protein VK666_18155 [Chryseolinea sp.]|nr:hypothetical protein [Chryseolinea sp.]